MTRGQLRGGLWSGAQQMGSNYLTLIAPNWWAGLPQAHRTGKFVALAISTEGKGDLTPWGRGGTGLTMGTK